MMYVSVDGGKKVSVGDTIDLDDISKVLTNKRTVGYATLFNEGNKIMYWTYSGGWKTIPNCDSNILIANEG